MAGTITKRGNSFRLKVSLGDDQYTKTVKCTEKQADKELSLFYSDCTKGLVEKGTNMTINNLADKWLLLCAEDNVKTATYVSYESIVRTSIKPNLGHLNVSRITALQVQEWIKLISKNHSPKTVQNQLTVLGSMMKKAIEWDITQNNPCLKVKAPKINKTEAKYFDKTQVIEAIKMIELETPKHKAMFLLPLFTGLRMGELAGLKWDCVHKDYIEIKQTRMYRPKHGVYIDTPKTEKSKRKISIPLEIYNLLLEVKHEQKVDKIKVGSKWEDTEYVLSGQFGGAIFPPRISHWWREFCVKNELSPITFHQLRHTHTSMLASMGLSPIEISRRLGHIQLITTQNIYTHLFENPDKLISDKLSTEYFTESYQNCTIPKK